MNFDKKRNELSTIKYIYSINLNEDKTLQFILFEFMNKNFAKNFFYLLIIISIKIKKICFLNCKCEFKT